MHTLHHYVTTFNKKQSQCFVCPWVCVRERGRPQGPMNQKIFQWPQMWHQPSLASCVVFTHIHVLTWWSKMPRADAKKYLSMLTWKQVTQAQMTQLRETQKRLHNKCQNEMKYTFNYLKLFFQQFYEMFSHFLWQSNATVIQRKRKWLCIYQLLYVDMEA